MSGYNIRLSSMLTFDEEKEADIIQVIETLNSMHKTGNFLSNLIRVSLDCPEILDQSNGKYSKGSTLVDLEQYGLSYNRRALADKNARDIAEMKKKVDAMYDMTLKLYTLALMNKHLGLEQKTENTMMANFIVEKQLGDLKKALGVNLSDNTFASNKIKDTKQIAEDSMEFIINTYEDIISDIKTNLGGQSNNELLTSIISNLSALNADNRVNISSNTSDNNNNIQDIKPAPSPVIEDKQNNISDNTQDEDVIDFGTEGLAELGTFFGV